MRKDLTYRLTVRAEGEDFWLSTGFELRSFEEP